MPDEMAGRLTEAASGAEMPIRQADQSLIDVRRPVARLAAMLLQHAHIRHDHPAIDGLAHVVNRQQPDLHGGQRFHLDPRLAPRLDLRPAMDAVVGRVDEARKLILVPQVGQNWDRKFHVLSLVYGLHAQLSSNGSAARFMWASNLSQVANCTSA